MSLTSLDRFAMLTPVTTNIATQPTPLRSHGPEARTSAGHAAVQQAGAVPPAAQHAVQIGLDARTVLANVNAEAATAGNRTVLQTLAVAVATQINVTRRNDETLDAFFLRIVAALEDMTPDQRALTELRTGLKLLRISLLDLSAALKQPDSPLAARLSAIIEAPLATPQKEAADSATTSYLQQEQTVPRAAETLAMVNQAKGNAQSSGLFSTATHVATADEPAAGAEDMQAQLKSLFEPGIAETRQDLARTGQGPSVVLVSAAVVADGKETTAATSAEALTEGQPAIQSAAQAAEALPEIVETRTSAAQAQAEPARPQAGPAAHRADEAKALPQPFAETVSERFEQDVPAAGSRARTEVLMPAQNSGQWASMRVRAIAQELVQAGLPPIAREAERQERGDHKVQTLLVLKGIAEVIELPAKALDLEPEHLQPALARLRNAADLPAASASASLPADPALPTAAETADHLEQAARRTPQSSASHFEERQPMLMAGHPAETGEQAAHAASRQAEATAAAKSAFVALDPVPFAYAAFQPAKDEFEAAPADERSRRDDNEEGAGDDAEDAEARRERLARKAIDDLLRPEAEEEPDLKITRDSSQSDRAYALYQRMGGF